MTPSKIDKHDVSSKSPLSKSSLDKTPPITCKSSLWKPSQSTSPNPSHLTPATRKPSNATSHQARRASTTPQSNQLRTPSATQSPEHLQPSSRGERKLSQNTSSQRKPSVTVAAQTRKASATPKQASPPKAPFTSPPRSTQPRKVSATPKPHSSPQPATRKTSCTTKPASPPKPGWIAPPGRYCSPSLSVSPLPSQIPLPTFASSVRKEGLSSPSHSRDELLTPIPDTNRRKSAVKESSPLVHQISEGDAADMTEARENSKERSKTEIRGLGLTFKDPFSSSILGSGSEAALYISGSGVSSSESAIPRLKSVHVTSPTSLTTPRSHVHAPNFHSNAIAAKGGKRQEKQTAGGKGKETPKRDSLSPPLSPISVPSFHTSASSLPAAKPIVSKIPHLTKLPNLRYRHLSSPSTLPPSPSTTHPYTGNTHITPSCTLGSLTHRLNCGHLVLTEKVEVCGGQLCGAGGKGKEQRGRMV